MGKILLILIEDQKIIVFIKILSLRSRLNQDQCLLKGTFKRNKLRVGI